MMASLAEQRRFIFTIKTVNTTKLQQIQADLMELLSKNLLTDSDRIVLDAVDSELNNRGRR
jgi:hypothetical protein